MKKAILVAYVVLSCFATISAQSGTANYASGCLGNPKTEHFNLVLQNDTLTVTGIIKGNCCGTNFLTYNVRNDSVLMYKNHTGDYCYCLCEFALNFRIGGLPSDSYRVIIYQTTLDTIVYAIPGMVDIQTEVAGDDTRCYPNPAKDKIFVEIPSSIQGEFTFVLYNKLGIAVAKIENTTNSFSLNRSNFAAGTYFYVIQTFNGIRFTGKLILE